MLYSVLVQCSHVKGSCCLGLPIAQYYLLSLKVRLTKKPHKKKENVNKEDMKLGSLFAEKPKYSFLYMILVKVVSYLPIQQCLSMNVT